MKRDSAIFRLVCLATGLLGLLVEISAVAECVENNKEIEEAWFEANRGRKEPAKLYELFERIQRVYASSDINDMSWYDQQRKKTYDILTAAWNPTPDQCSAENFTWSDHFERYSLMGAMGDYWTHCEHKRISVCEPVLEAQLKAEVDQIREVTTGHRVKLLVDSVTSECTHLKLCDVITRQKEREKVLAAGALKYLETLEGPLSKSVFKFMRNAEDRFRGVYKRLVGDLCFVVFETGKKPMKVLKVIKQYNEAWEPTGLIKLWMEADEICSFAYLTAYEGMTFKLLREQIRARGLFGRGP